jgi:hypothetical protein
MEKTVIVKEVKKIEKKDKAGEFFYAVKMVADGADIEALAFDVQMEKLTGSQTLNNVEKNGKNFIVFSKKVGGGRLFGKSPEELAAQASTMTLSYAKDLVIAFRGEKMTLDEAVAAVQRVHAELMGMVKVKELPKESRLPKIEMFIASLIADEYKIPENTLQTIAQRFSGSKDAQKVFHPNSKFIAEMTDTEIADIQKTFARFRSECPGNIVDCKWSKSQGTCDWVGICLYKEKAV